MNLSLVPHPANPSDAITDVLVTADRDRFGINCSFRAVGRRDEVRWPPELPKGFSDELWKHTCFEAFAGIPGHESYVEINLSPSRRWATYYFDGYRSGMRRAGGSPHWYFLTYQSITTVMAGFSLPELDPALEWEVGLSAVIETLDGSRNYFALAHPPGNPDFHNRDCFTLRLPPPPRV
ncbi:DOMON-like domain-containing protein [Sphingomonas sp. GlSt437]|uniref:DOMON-like domain-containing protein n=1 Tax=Sphingomonas sp. GlSt437 TaxID=3389970 RepID=UPI003A8371A7